MNERYFLQLEIIGGKTKVYYIDVSFNKSFTIYHYATIFDTPLNEKGNIDTNYLEFNFEENTSVKAFKTDSFNNYDKFIKEMLLLTDSNHVSELEQYKDIHNLLSNIRLIKRILNECTNFLDNEHKLFYIFNQEELQLFNSRIKHLLRLKYHDKLLFNQLSTSNGFVTIEILKYY